MSWLGIRVLPCLVVAACSQDDVPPASDILGVYGSSGCVLTEDGGIACWHDYTDPSNVELPDFEQSPGRVVADDARGLSVGLASCALFGAGIKCWGPSNDYGPLGYGDTLARGEQEQPVPDLEEFPFVDLGVTSEVVSISSDLTSCALFENGALKCWGQNFGGALGLGDREHRGDEAGEMGTALPAIDLGAGSSVVQVDTFRRTTCAILDDGRLKCWGANIDWELGLGDTEDRGDEPGEMGDALPAVDLGKGLRAVDVGVGAAHVCAALDNGGLKCWGRNHVIPDDDPSQTPIATGRLGYEDTRHRGVSPDEMGDALPFVDVGTGRSVIAVDAGFLHTCALLDSGEVKCWGSQANSALDGPQNFEIYDSIGDEPGEMGDALPAYDFGGRRAVALAVHGDSNCAKLDDGAVHCWGSGNELDWPILLP